MRTALCTPIIILAFLHLSPPPPCSIPFTANDNLLLWHPIICFYITESMCLNVGIMIEGSRVQPVTVTNCRTLYICESTCLMREWWWGQVGYSRKLWKFYIPELKYLFEKGKIGPTSQLDCGTRQHSMRANCLMQNLNKVEKMRVNGRFYR